MLTWLCSLAWLWACSDASPLARRLVQEAAEFPLLRRALPKRAVGGVRYRFQLWRNPCVTTWNWCVVHLSIACMRACVDVWVRVRCVFVYVHVVCMFTCEWFCLVLIVQYAKHDDRRRIVGFCFDSLLVHL